MLSSSYEPSHPCKPEKQLASVPGGGTKRDTLLAGAQGGSMKLPPAMPGTYHEMCCCKISTSMEGRGRCSTPWRGPACMTMGGRSREPAHVEDMGGEN